MGCCVSTSAKNKTSKPSPPNTKCTAASKSPPPSHPLPEETVKEVLTESVPKPNRVSSPFIKSAPLLTNFAKNGAVDEKKLRNGGVYKPLANEEPSEEVSEIYSTVSESVSVTTDKKENDDMFREVRQKSPVKVRSRTFAGEVRAVGRSPGRVRPEASPGRVRSGSGPVYGRRRENGESSGRRSRSPVTRVEPGSGSGSSKGRTPSARRAGKSPGRAVNGPCERVRRLGQEDPQTNNELLENPLVSLECFIFL